MESFSFATIGMGYWHLEMSLDPKAAEGGREGGRERHTHAGGEVDLSFWFPCCPLVISVPFLLVVVLLSTLLLSLLLEGAGWQTAKARKICTQ